MTDQQFTQSDQHKGNRNKIHNLKSCGSITTDQHSFYWNPRRKGKRGKKGEETEKSLKKSWLKTIKLIKRHKQTDVGSCANLTKDFKKFTQTHNNYTLETKSKT